MRGHFITLEGIEGAGKSTALQFLQRVLQEKGIPLIVTREPGGTPIGEQIRQLLLDRRVTQMAVDTELLLMFASRSQLIAEVIRPALAKGYWVLSDRFTDATYAYQGGGRGIAFERIATIEQWVQGDLHPDLTLLLDVPAQVGLERIQRYKALDRIESEQIDFFERVRVAYWQRAQADPNRYRIIDACQTLAKVQQQLYEIITYYDKTIQ